MTCYRVLMFDPRSGLHWQPIFVADSPEEATERASTAYPARTIVAVIALHSDAHVDRAAIESDRAA